MDLQQDSHYWSPLNSSSLAHSYFAHRFYGGDDMILGQEEACQVAHTFVVESTTGRGHELEPFDIEYGVESLLDNNGNVSMSRLIEELSFL